MTRWDRRTAMALLAAAGLAPRTALAADPRVLRVPIALEDGRIQLPVSMNGKGPFTFMVDTGTYISLIRPELAKQLGLPVQGYERTQGIGGQGKAFALYLAQNVVIGDSIRQPNVMFEDSFEFGEKQGVFGALAAGMLTAVDTELDFDARELRLYPDGRGERPGFVAIKSEIPRPGAVDRGSRRIMVDAAVDGRTIRCILDTGSPTALLLGQRAAKAAGLWDDRPYAPSRRRGIGGVGPVARTVRVDSLTLGSARSERPLVTLLGNEIGDVDGIVGLPFIRRFNLSIDTRRGGLWVKPSGQPASPDERYGLSGLWLDRDGTAIVVAAVGIGSPAAQAGIAAGDRVVGDWDTTIRAIGGRAGGAATLKIARGAATRDVSLALAPYL